MIIDAKRSSGYPIVDGWNSGFYVQETLLVTPIEVGCLVMMLVMITMVTVTMEMK